MAKQLINNEEIMAKQTLNNGDSGFDFRNKINENITELYDTTVKNTGNQTIQDTITFESAPVVPDATLPQHPVTLNQIPKIKNESKYQIAKSSNLIVTHLSNGIRINSVGTVNHVVYTPAGGYYTIAEQSVDITPAKLVYLSKSATEDVRLDEKINYAGGNVYIRSRDRLSWNNNTNIDGLPVLGFVSGVNTWSTPHASLKIFTDEKVEDIITDSKYVIAVPSSGITVAKVPTGINIKVTGSPTIVLTAGGGYYSIADTDETFASNHRIVYLSTSATEDIPLNPLITDAGGSVYLRSQLRATWKSIQQKTNFPVIGFASVGWESKYKAFDITINTDSRYLQMEQEGILPAISKMQSPIIAGLSSFVEKNSKRRQDVTVVQTGDSISTNAYASARSDAAYRPPLMTDLSLPSRLEEKLRWREQQYRRYDAKTIAGGATSVFTEILGGGAATNITQEDATWGFTAGSNFYYALTRCIDSATNAGVSFTYPANMRRCNFIYHSDFKFAAATTVAVTQGNGLVEVWNGAAWVEANGYSFSAKEDGTLLNDATYGNYHKDVYQKRLKMRSLTNLTEKTITIQNSGVGRFGYWGIEYSPKEYMFTYINASKGGHNIAKLRLFESWMVDDFNPDLILQQCCIINEQCQTGLKSGYPANTSPVAFASKFETYYDDLVTTKQYLVVPYILFVGMQAGIVDEATGEWGSGYIAGYGEITISDYIGHLAEMYRAKNAPFINCFNQFLAIAEQKAKNEGTLNIFTSAILGSAATGNTFTSDSVHFNDYGNEIAFRLIDKYLSF